ncbi:anti-sigma factor [Demequina soli]|uniref:anti-sigma factor n=1 Tax=Demequina soli TaxID=1638987 RepID=UPI000784C306|nr:anti-sigma factor [Demequina soli]
MTDNVHALIGAYAVDAVTPAERAEFEAHLGGCEDCSLELTGLREATATLAGAADAPAPAGLRARVLEEVGRTAQVPPAVDDAPAAEAPPAPAHRPWWTRMAVAAVAALVLAVGGLVGSTLVSERQHQLALEKDVMMVTTAPDAHAMDLSLGASHLVMSDRMGSVAAMGDHVPMPDAGMEYQLWAVMDDGSMHAGPTFMPGSDGSFMTVMDMSMDGVAAFAVTEEPHGGSTEPSSDPIAEVAL